MVWSDQGTKILGASLASQEQVGLSVTEVSWSIHVDTVNKAIFLLLEYVWSTQE